MMQKKISVESNYEKNNITGLMKRFSRSNIREEDVKKFLFMRKIKLMENFMEIEDRAKYAVILPIAETWFLN